MRLIAPAKINLHLRVGPRIGAGLANEGFHPLLTWMATVALFDTLSLEIVTPLASGSPDVVTTGQDAIALRCDDPALPTDSSNLVVRAANALADTLGRDGEGPTGRRERVSAFLAKSVPAGAGLGGGSSDAAATLRGLARLWKVGWGNRRLADFSARLGSDIPFFFHGPSSVCTGRGETVRPVASPAVKWVILILPAVHLATPEVYRVFDQMNLGREQDVLDEPDWRSWVALKSDDLLLRLVNDLEPPAFALRPDLSVLRDDLERDLGKVVRMSGSGSSLFTLADDPDRAQALAARMNNYHRIRAGAYELASILADDASDATDAQSSGLRVDLDI